ncbi:zinc-binding dehydrogenase [Streptomyces fagopyri]|uniref:zinc-binding dehydrogenase n=1 Tax=Streptomyces fagopyri TaxID=2662397 RepID=UPI003806389A
MARPGRGRPPDGWRPGARSGNRRGVRRCRTTEAGGGRVGHRGRTVDFVKELGAEHVVDHRGERFEGHVKGVDLVLDTVGGDTQDRSWQVPRPGGPLVSIVSPPGPDREGGRFFVVGPDRAGLDEPARTADAGTPAPRVDRVLPLTRATQAYAALGAGAPPRQDRPARLLRRRADEIRDLHDGGSPGRGLPRLRTGVPGARGVPAAGNSRTGRGGVADVPVGSGRTGGSGRARGFRTCRRRARPRPGPRASRRRSAP